MKYRLRDNGLFYIFVYCSITFDGEFDFIISFMNFMVKNIIITNFLKELMKFKRTQCLFAGNGCAFVALSPSCFLASSFYESRASRAQATVYSSTHVNHTSRNACDIRTYVRMYVHSFPSHVATYSDVCTRRWMHCTARDVCTLARLDYGLAAPSKG